MATLPQDEMPVPAAPEEVRPQEASVFSFGGYLAEAESLPGASFWPRAAARIIDLVIHLGVFGLTSFFFGILLAIAAGLAGRDASLLLMQLQEGASLFQFLATLLGYTAYHTVTESIHGSSLGKLILSMVVLQEDGSPCRFGSALIRNLGYHIDSLFFGLVGYFSMKDSYQQQRFGDHWAHTIVFNKSNAPAGSLRGAGRFVLGFLTGMMADSALIMVGFLLKLAV